MKKNVLILIDIQKEYLTEGRPYYLKGISDSLEKCKGVLAFARVQEWDTVHIQHSNRRDAPKFNPAKPCFDFVEGFEPKAGEKYYLKYDFSCYSSQEFEGDKWWQ